MEEETKPIYKEKQTGTGHYLDNPDVRRKISENWPEVPLERVETAVKPGLSRNPDELEKWEANQRKKRISVLAAASGGDALRELQTQMYEECFGVNATPGVDESFRDSVAPTPGGLISHGYPRARVNGYDLEAVARLNFSGEDAKTAVQSLPTMNEREGLAGVLVETLYPLQFGPGSYMSERQRQITREQLLGDRSKPQGEVTTWALRLVKMVQEEPAMLAAVKDPELLTLAGIRAGSEVTLASYWSMAWRRFSRTQLEENEYGNSVYRDPQNPETAAEIGKLIAIRTHPEMQIMFKYLSPSGYLNNGKEA
jgi:hypothetical protein